MDDDLNPDEWLVLLHADGWPWPDDPHAREVWARLDHVDVVLRGLRDPLPIASVKWGTQCVNARGR